jgi:hypothetical protein
MSIVWEYLEERLERYSRNPSDDLLYRIGTHVDTLTVEDIEQIQRQGGNLTPSQRYRVLNWVCACTKWEPQTDLALLIFGRNQLEEWLKISRQAYPNFEFYLSFEYQEGSKTGWETGINFTLHWMPLPGAPVPDPEYDFPWKVFWDSGEMFWGNLPNNTKNDFEFTLSVYPDQRSFTIPGSICEAGDWYTTPTDEEAQLMSIAQVLQHFAIPA